MSKYLISFPAAAMLVPAEELPAVAEAAHAVIREAKAAGVYVFAGGIDAAVTPLRVAGDGSVREGAGTTNPTLDGGFTVLELPSREAALTWAARLAAACRCEQELRVFMFDPES
ncbi:MAG: transcription initiation protein [Burkholderiales bacterium PBB2]|nr:MAG: transcription initiation protein [Burkholderiales bacterium PBB2]